MNIPKTALAMSSAFGVPDLIQAVDRFSLADVLGLVGLERRPGTLGRILPAAGLIAVSAAVGAGIALLLAPSSGDALRARLSDGLDDAKERLNETIASYDAPKTSRHAVS